MLKAMAALRPASARFPQGRFGQWHLSNAILQPLMVFTLSLGGPLTWRECRHFPRAFSRVAQEDLHAKGDTLHQTVKCGLSILFVPIYLVVTLAASLLPLLTPSWVLLGVGGWEVSRVRRFRDSGIRQTRS